MQRAEKIKYADIEKIVESIFQEPAVVYEDYSEFDSETKKFETKEELLRHIDIAHNNGEFFRNYTIYYPVAKGHFHLEKKSVNPEKCNGATYRYIANGWGLIELQISLKEELKKEIRIAVNSYKRALAWEPTYPELKEAELWDWCYVEKQARRLIRVLKKCA